MALISCTPCTCIPGTIGNEKFKQDMEIILCGIYDALVLGGSAVNLTAINGVSPVAVDNGVSNTGTLRVTVASDSTGVLGATQSGAWTVGVNNAGGAAAVNIQDGGNSITVDGTVAATQSGVWNIGSIAGPVALPTGAATEVTLAAANTNLATIVTTTFTTASAVRIEDAPIAASGSFMLMGAIRQNAPIQDTSADADGSYLKVDSLGKLWGASDHAEDNGHVSGSVGKFVMGVRNDANAVLTSANLDYSPFSVTSTGATNIADAGGSITVDGADLTTISNNTLPLALAIGTEDAAVAAGGLFYRLGTQRQDVPNNDTSADGDGQYLKGDSIGKLWTADNQIEDTVHATGDRGSFALGVINTNLVTLAGSELDYCGFATDNKGRSLICGQTDHSEVPAGFPVTIAGEARSTFGSLVSDGEVVRFMNDLSGRPITRPFAPTLSILNFSVDLGSTADVTLIANPGAGFTLVLLSLTYTFDGAVSDNVSIYENSSAGTRLDRVALITSDTHFHTYVGGLTMAANTSLVANSVGSTSWSISGTYFINPV